VSFVEKNKHDFFPAMLDLKSNGEQSECALAGFLVMPCLYLPNNASNDVQRQRGRRQASKFPARSESVESSRPIAASPFTDEDVFNAVKRMSRQAATALVKILRQAQGGAAPGGSGWTGSLYGTADRVGGVRETIAGQRSYCTTRAQAVTLWPATWQQC